MVEAAAAYRARGLDFGAHAVAITQDGSALDRQAREQGFLARFPMWDWVGGRTSVTSAVGLLPGGAPGDRRRRPSSPGRRRWTRPRAGARRRRNPAALLALAWHAVGEGRGSKAMVVLPYKDRLLLFSRYLQQLVMESIGKEKDLAGRVVHQGLAVYGNKGSTDQHAFVQQLRDGTPDFFVTFVRVLKDREGASLEVEPGATSGDFLDGLLLGTRRALFESGRPSLTLTIQDLTPRSLGMLIALYERAVGLYASLVGINAYHQPGVEAGKKAAASVLDLQRRVVAALRERGAAGGTCEELAAAAGAPGRGGDGLPPARAPRREPGPRRRAARRAAPFDAVYVGSLSLGRAPSTRRPSAPTTCTVRVGKAKLVPASSTIRMMPRRASCRRSRNSPKSLVWNQQRTSTSSDEGEKASELRHHGLGPDLRVGAEQRLDARPRPAAPAPRSSRRRGPPWPRSGCGRGRRSPRSACRRACRSGG